jgi:hypothetical protein
VFFQPPAAAILDRLLHNGHRITLKGASMRRLYDSTKEETKEDSKKGKTPNTTDPD